MYMIRAIVKTCVTGCLYDRMNTFVNYSVSDGPCCTIFGTRLYAVEFRRIRQ